MHPSALPKRAVSGMICAVREQPGELGGLVETRWNNWGNRRVYLKTVDGTEVGYIDLIKDVLVVDVPEHQAAAQDAFERWRAVYAQEVAPTSPAAAASGTPQPTESKPPVEAKSAKKPRPSVRPKSPELPTLIEAKFEQACAVCGTTINKGDEVFWVPGTTPTVCPPCTAAEVSAGLDTGRAGAAATRIADGGSRKHAEKLLRAYPMLGQYINDNARPPSYVHSWVRGADGERIVGRKLDIAAEKGHVIVLHDRRVSSGGNIDHIVIGSRRLCVIDAKHYRNTKVTKRDDQLCLNGKPDEQLIDGVRGQRAKVQEALADRPLVADNVCALLAFVGATFGFTGSVTHRGVYCCPVKEAVAFAAYRGPVIGRDTIKLDADERLEIAKILSDAFPAN